MSLNYHCQNVLTVIFLSTIELFNFSVLLLLSRNTRHTGVADNRDLSGYTGATILTSSHTRGPVNVSTSITYFAKWVKGHLHLHKKLLLSSLWPPGKLIETKVCCKLALLQHMALDNHIIIHTKYINDMYSYWLSGMYRQLHDRSWGSTVH